MTKSGAEAQLLNHYEVHRIIPFIETMDLGVVQEGPGPADPRFHVLPLDHVGSEGQTDDRQLTQTQADVPRKLLHSF